MCDLQQAIQTMTGQITAILAPCTPSVYLYGSCVLGDFRLGWSDIDLLVLTQQPIAEAQAQQLVGLRQAMLAAEPGNPYYRCFEGGMLPLAALASHAPGRIVYWGTTGERITDHYALDAFSLSQLIDSGWLLHGPDVRGSLARPTDDDLKAAVHAHYQAIRRHAQVTDSTLYAYGWLLDISRCLYTLRTGRIIAKTAGGEWALREQLCPCADALDRAVAIRKSPLAYRSDARTLAAAQALGPAIQRYADVLEQALQEYAAR